MNRTCKLIVLFLLCACIAARAGTYDLAGLDQVVAQSKKVVFVYLVLDDDKIVVRDSNNCLWKLVFLKHYPGAYGNGYNHQPMILEATVTKGITASDHSEVYHVEYRIVLPPGQQLSEIILKSVERWTPDRI